MSSTDRILTKKVLREAEGYLELGMPQHTLDVLVRLDAAALKQSRALYLKGEALRALERYEEALKPLQRAAGIAPGNVSVWLALGWCLKRVGQIDQAIESLEQAMESATEEEEKALIFYNLGCYWSLAGDKRRVLEYLSLAFASEPKYRDLVADEPDFDPLRTDPDFLALTSIIV
jgi:tetratricopeptide (TPR) repeat protein